jgi:hypothetical protein
MTPEELSAREEIRAVVHGYCRAADRCDGELLRSVYHPDATEDHGGFVGGAAQFCDEVIPRLRALWTGTHHVLGQIHIELDGDVAHVESYFVGYHVRAPDERGRVLMWQLGGRYVDRFERRDSAWLIAHRLLIEDWEDMREIKEEGGRPFERGRRDRRDGSYGR